MPLFSTAELNAIKSDINNLVIDTSINTLIKYRQYTGTDYYEPKDQQYNKPYTDWSGVSALKGMITQKELRTISGIEAGDVKFVFMQSSVSNTLSVSDVIVESGVTYPIRKIMKDPLGVVYITFAESA